MMQGKRVWAVLFAAVLMALALSCAAAEDDEVFTFGDYSYRVLEDGTAEIAGYQGSKSALVIPETLDGKSVTSIGDEAFSWCSSLTSVELPDSVTSMGANPFKGSKLLKNIRVSTEQPVFAVIDGVLFNKAEKSLICYPAGKQADAYKVPQGIQQIGDYALYCASLTSIELPDGVTNIGNKVFSGCSSLTSIELPDGVTSIGNQAFSGCSSLTSIELSDSVTSIGIDAFRRCKALTNIVIPDSVTSIGAGAFSICLALTDIIIPDSVTSIEFYTFYHCEALKNVTIPESVTYIDSGAFEGCDNLTLTVPHDSYAAQYAKDNGLNYTYPDANDWLNN